MQPKFGREVSNNMAVLLGWVGGAKPGISGSHVFVEITQDTVVTVEVVTILDHRIEAGAADLA